MSFYMFMTFILGETGLAYGRETSEIITISDILSTAFVHY